MASMSYALKLAASLALPPQLPDTFPASGARVQRKAETAPLSRLFVGMQVQLRHMFCMIHVALHTFRALTPSELTCKLACKLMPDNLAGLWHTMLVDENIKHRTKCVNTMLSAVVAANAVVADLHSDLSGLTCLRKRELSSVANTLRQQASTVFIGCIPLRKASTVCEWGHICVAPICEVVLCATTSCVT